MMGKAVKNFFSKLFRPIRERFARLARVIGAILLSVKLAALAVYAFYLIYRIVSGTYIVFTSILLALTVIYAIFYAIKHDKIDKPSRAAKKISRRLYSASKIIINGCTLALTILGLFTATRNPTIWSVLLAEFMLISWTASLLFELLYLFAERQAERIAREAQTVGEKMTSAKEKRASLHAQRKEARKSKAKKIAGIFKRGNTKKDNIGSQSDANGIANSTADNPT